MRDRLLIVDDEVGVRKQIAWGLKDQFEISEAADADAALESFGELRPSVVTLDVRLTGPRCRAGMGLLRTMLVEDPTVKVIMVTADTDDSNATRALELGAWDYHCKPIITSSLLDAAVRAARVRRLQSVSRRTPDVLVAATDFGTWMGDSETARRVERLLRSLAGVEESVLILGEPGTGRDLSARAIHELGDRREEPFVEIDCARPLPQPISLPEGATIFLDDVTALDAGAAAELPAWIESASASRRVLASGPADLAAVVAAGEFPERARQYLSRLTALLPALREHPEDIPKMAANLLDHIAICFGARATALDADAERALSQHRWPGNFRELEKRLLGAALVAEGERLAETDLWLGVPASPGVQLKEKIAEIECTFIEHALRRHNGNVSRAAPDLGVSRQTLHALMRKHDIDPAPFRSGAES